MAEWQNRPLDPVCAVIFIDAINVKIREGQVANRPVYLALGVTVDGERDVLGLWAGEHGDGKVVGLAQVRSGLFLLLSELCGPGVTCGIHGEALIFQVLP